jgi:putative peptidoglycan lipid II flippase
LANQPVEVAHQQGDRPRSVAGYEVADTGVTPLLAERQQSDQPRSVARAALLVMSLLAVSKVVGVIDDLVKARVFGTSAELDAFIAAGGLPELLNTVISGGALAAPFIPVLAGYLSQNDREGAWRLVSNVVNLALLATAVLAVLVAAFAPWLVTHVIASGFSPEQQALTAGLMRLTLVSTLIFAASGVVMSVLHAHQHFLLPALAPILFNLGIIGGAVFLARPWGVWGLAVGAVAGSAMHLLIQVPGLLRYRARWLPVLDFDDPGLRRVLQLMGPRVLTLGVVQLNMLVAVRLASDMSAGSVSALNFGWRLMQMPETVIGTAIATAVFPTLSELAAQGRTGQLRDTLAAALRAVLAMGMPAALGLVLLGRPLIELLFGGGQFGSASTDAVLAALSGYAVGLVGHAALEVAARAFFARQDTRTPLLVAVLGMIITVALSLGLRGPLGHAGLALANSLGVSSEVLLLLWLARRPLGGLEGSRLGFTLLRAAVATGVMGLALAGLSAWWPLSTDGLVRQAFFLGAGLVIGVVIYLLAAWRLGLDEIRSLWRRGVRMVTA